MTKINYGPIYLGMTVVSATLLGLFLSTVLELKVLPERYWFLCGITAITGLFMHRTMASILYEPSQDQAKTQVPSPTEIIKLQGRASDLMTTLRRSIENFEHIYKLYVKMEKREEDLEVAVTNLLDMIQSCGYPKHICAAEADHMILVAGDLVAYRPRSSR